MGRDRVPVEIEAKIKVETHAAVRARLEQLGAVRRGKVKEVNRILDDPQRSLRGSGRGLRVRSVEVLDGPDVPASLTYKGPRKKSGLKVRDEFEIPLSDPARALDIFEALGYRPFISFEKIRETWKLGPCAVELDEVPLLGRFIEIQGPDEEAVDQTRRDLGLADHPHIAHSYVHMLAAVCQASGRSCASIRF